MVFHKCVSCNLNTLSECASYGCLAKTLEETCLSGIVNAIPVALWSSGNQLDAIYYQFSKDLPPIRSFLQNPPFLKSEMFDNRV